MSLLPELMLRQSHSCPTAPAVLTDDGSLSYRELAGRASQICHALRAGGVGIGSVVGVLMRPGAELVATLWGIWLAGGAYLPLDPLHPPDRQRRLLAAAGVELVLTDRPGAGGLAAAPGSPVAVRRLTAAERARYPATLPEPVTHPRQAAYLVFTSGSTGQPKGVVIEHAGVANRVRWGVRALSLTAADRVLQKTPLTFDAAMWEIFAPLLCGAPVVFGAPDAGRDPQSLLASVRRQSATVLQVVPSMLRLLAAEPQLRQCRTLRVICSAGEPLQAELCQRVLAQLPVEVWNTYGPTECSIDVTATRFDPAMPAGPVPIGAPIDNIRGQSVVPDGSAAAPGDTGELYVGGVGLGRGYHGEPARTAERFLPDPAGPPGSRRYRTGDLVRSRPDGSFEFVGRVDAQVKVNGVRIEPAEVESALLSHPAVVDAAVRAATDPGGSRRLVAYVVVAAGGVIDELTAHLRARLPQSLVPATITTMAALPRTSSGKTDRARLPEPDWGAAATPPAAAAPRDAPQRVVLGVWRQLLGRDDIGLDDDFFRLGGHSLLMTRLAAGLTEASGLELELPELYQRMTVRSQAELLTGAMRATAIPRLPAEARLPLSHAQERFWLLGRMSPGSPEYLLPVPIRLPHGTPVETVRRALTQLAARHDVLRSYYPMDADGLRAVIEPDPRVVLRTVHTTTAGLDAAATEEFATGFDLTEGPLWRAVLIDHGGGGEQLLLLVCHHIICDGWSTGVLDRDVRELVAAQQEGRDPRLPPLPLRYVDAAAWQRSQLTTELLSRQLEYWRRTLADLPPLELPSAGPRAPQRSVSGAVVTFTMPAEVVEPLLAAGRHAGATPFMVFLTLWTAALAQAGGRWDFGVGTPHAGRSRPELYDLVGLFLNTVVIRPGLTPELSFTEALDQVRLVCRESFSHHLAPFESVVDAVEPARDLSRTPLFQTLFSLLEDGLIGPSPGEAEVALLRRVWSVARTDLTLTMWPSADGGFGGAVEYASALFPEPAVVELVARLRTLAARFAAEPGTPLGATEVPGVGTGPAVAGAAGP